jgi:hypothetical protein
MADVVNINGNGQQAAATTFVRDFLTERFTDLLEDPSGGWTALCPICDSGARVAISRSLVVLPCPNGHSAAAILDAAKPATEPTDALERVRSLEGATLAEIEALDIPPPEWLVEGFVEQASFGVVFGPPNSGKTFFAIHVICLAAAMKWRVKFIEAEGSLFHTRKRLLRAAASIEGVQRDNINLSWCAPLNISTEEGYDELVASIRGYDLCVLDSMAALSGGVNENEEAWARVSNHLAWARAVSDCAILGLHHSTKEAWKPGETPELRHLRGHGALAGRADYAFGLVPGPAEDGRVVFDLHDLKERESEKPKPRRCKIDMISGAAHFTVDPIGPAEPVTINNHLFLAEVERLLPAECNHVKGRCMSKTKLENIVPARAQKVRRAIDQLDHSGRIKLVQKGCYIRVDPVRPSGTDRTDRPGEDPVRPSPPLGGTAGSGRGNGIRPDQENGVEP